MKISDFIFRYTSHRSVLHDSLCRVRLFYDHQQGRSVLLTDLGSKNPGPSVTNSIESLRRTLIDTGHIDDATHIIEHYEEASYRKSTYDFVTFKNGVPDWQSTTITKTAQVLSCDEFEISGDTFSDQRLARQIEKLRVLVDPHVDRPYEESPNVINRRSDIRRNSVPLQQLRALVERGAAENVLQSLIKSDLSLIAEVYAQPDDEYIAFSEFPLDTGRVDFALFSGRSRMDITLIEIKGAEFSMTTKNSYKNLNAKFNEARQQISSRLGYVYREYPTFRALMHKIRAQAEAGQEIYGSFRGPKGTLLVDPEKDVNVQYVVIGGRTGDDQQESKLRHEFEISFNPRIRLESWDSWIRKLRRY